MDIMIRLMIIFWNLYNFCCLGSMWLWNLWVFRKWLLLVQS